MFTRLQPAPWQAAQFDSFPDLGRFFNHVLHELNHRTSHASPSFPPLNIWEKDDALHVEAPLAGYQPEDVNVSVVGDELLLEAQAPRITSDERSFHRRERNLPAFKRAVRLPFPVDEDGVAARYVNGMLTVQLPKARTAMPRQIKIESTQA